ncbi:MAG TPA: uroporphyrinogen decarboxylase family protein [Armatimonadota bacterium]|nr:uroporphyrinogen decarboxylase family protein [Armatimonadota bacterium]
MTQRERFLGITGGEARGELYLAYNLNYGWFMPETLERWHGEGLPANVDLADYFGLDRVSFSGGGAYALKPAFELEVLAEDEETQTIRDESGVTKRVFTTHGETRMPQWLDHPVKTREDFRELKKRLDPDTPSRYPADWDAFAEQWAEREIPLGLGPGSFYGHTLQRWVGTEHLCMLLYDDPSFVEEMLEYLEWFFLQLLQRFLDPSGPLGGRVKFDFASFGEDIAYKGRAFLSPAMFRRFIQPHYVSICSLLRASGIDCIFVDSDGLIDELIPLWMEVGINGFSPLEVAAGSDALALKKQYGDDIVIAGSIDKRALIWGGSAIDDEVAKARALMDLGQYFPAVDHSVPPEVPLGNWRLLLDGLRGA